MGAARLIGISNSPELDRQAVPLLMPPQLLILAVLVYRRMRSVTRDYRATYYGIDHLDQHATNTMGVVDPDQMSI